MSAEQRRKLLWLHEKAMMAWGEAKAFNTTNLWSAFHSAEGEYQEFLDSVKDAA